VADVHYDVLIVGGGFGGAYAAQEFERILRRRHERVLLVAPDNFLLFSPLLPEAASGTIEPRHAVIPLREILHRTDLVVGTIETLDVDARTAVAVDETGTRTNVSFRAVVISPGSTARVLPIPGLTEHAVGFKNLTDAIWLRNRVLAQLETANATIDETRRRALLTFTFIGGGYAGVEALAELESLARDALRMYPKLRPGDLRWVLIEAQPTLLPGLAPMLARYSERLLRDRDVEVYTESRLASCIDSVVTLDRPDVTPYGSDTIVWTAGQRPSPFVAELGLPTDPNGRVVVDEFLAVPGRSAIYVIGDACSAPDPEGGRTPATAQHALREGRVAARNAAADLGIGARAPFRYRNRGLAVTMGRWRGTAQVKKFGFTGPLAWWMGRSYHLLMLPGLSRKVRVVIDWTLAMLFPRDVSQLGSLQIPRRLE
jgi:NADH:ubiquinone reductase (H+-translocating)